MPEGDTIHKLATWLAPRLTGQRLAAGRVPGAGTAELGGLTVVGVEARGKHLHIALDDGRDLRTHLGMWGSWHHYRAGEPWRRPQREAAVVLETGERVYVCFNPREVELLRRSGVRARILGQRLGPDLLAPDASLETVGLRARAILEPETPAVDLLLDQRVAAGIGNVYKSEVLFLEGVPPLRPLGQLGGQDLARLYARARRLLQANTGRGPRATRPGAGSRDRLWVYGRRGEPCLHCGAAVRSARLGRDQRATYWCPRCQQEGEGEDGEC